MSRRIVVALGGNALQKEGQTSYESQKHAVRETARQLVELAREGCEIVVVHGNGPQVGAILASEESAPAQLTLDTCVAMSQGEIGYWLQQALGNELRASGIEKSVATIVTQCVVDANDPAFQDPSKPVGRFYPDKSAAQAASGADCVVKEDSNRGWRRVVASPQPKSIVEEDFISRSVASDSIVIAAGGGGVPVVATETGYEGVDAVIDKDFAAERIAELIDADTLIILTAVPAVSIDFGKPNQKPLHNIGVNELDRYIQQGQFAPGSMLPKAQASKNFVESGQGRAVIVTSPENLVAAWKGQEGTHIAR